ncbi:MAG: DNA-3-methyladenine glycosylase [Solirubrobacterales bacterium]
MARSPAGIHSPSGELGARLPEAFFARSVHDVARELIGCCLLFDGVGGVIVETESYHADDPACHAAAGLTARNAPIYGPPGRAYVYRSYGIHNLLNAVAEPEGAAAAVLIRALEPRWGLATMRSRRGRTDERELCSGPGKLTEAIGVGMAENATNLLAEPFVVAGAALGWEQLAVVTGPRIGISKGVELPWRFCAAGSKFVSMPAP